MSTTPSTCHSNNQPCNLSCSSQHLDASLSWVHNQCGFCKVTCTINWTDCKMHNPTTSIQMDQDFNKLHKKTKLCSPVHLLLCPLIIPACHRIASVTFPLPTMLTTITATLAAALAVICAAMTFTIMISAVSDHHALALTAIILSTIMSIPLGSSILTSRDVNLWACQFNFLKFCHILTALITLPGTLTQMKILPIPFKLTAMDIVKTTSQLLFQQFIWIMNSVKHPTLAGNSQQIRLLFLTFSTIMTLRPRNSATGITPNLTNSPQLG